MHPHAAILPPIALIAGADAAITAPLAAIVVLPTRTIDIFAPGSSTLEAQIGGSNTGLNSPASVTVDAALNVYVFGTRTETISEFAAGERNTCLCGESDREQRTGPNDRRRLHRNVPTTGL